MSKSMKFWATVAMTAGLLAVQQSAAATNATLAVQIEGVGTDGRFPDSAAFCPPQKSSRRNISPGVSWSAGPKGTRSYVLLMIDPDVPRDLSLINKPGTVISTDEARMSVFHWALVDIPSRLNALASGAESDGLVPGGKPIGATPHGRRGANVYTTFLANTEGMAGTYGGYDGPCPPVNDERVHRYIVRVIALDVETLGLTGAFDGEAVERAIEGHVLASGETVATYTLNPSLIEHVEAR